MRRKLIAGNWKMNGDRAALVEIDEIAASAERHTGVDVAVCPPFTLVALAAERQPALPIGGQDCHAEPKGAYTGCVSAEMLVEAGARFVIVGHSERRSDCKETDVEIKAKATAAIGAGLIAIVCIGETEAERDAGEAGTVVSTQLDGSVPTTGNGDNLVIAYEPIWAIGTGRTPEPDEIAEMHGLIRVKLEELLGERGDLVRVLYGGSVKPENAAEILALDDVDGALVGGASLTAANFVPIVEAAAGL